jgi:hypothetical protein
MGWPYAAAFRVMRRCGGRGLTFEGVKADPELFAESRLISVKEVVICG